MSQILRIGLVVCLALGLLWLDVSIPLGVAIGVLYAALVFLGSTVRYGLTPVFVAGFSTLLIAVGTVISPAMENVPGWMILANRALSLVVIWISVFFLLQRRRDMESLQRAHGELEMRVRDRTAELGKVNQALVAEITERMETERSLRLSEAALSNNRLALQRSEEDLRGLTARLLTAQEEERRRISRDLHDDINQRLAMLVVELETLEQALPPGSNTIGTRLRSLQDNASELCEDLRHLAYQFHPSVLDDLGLTVALRRLVDDIALRTGLKGSFRSPAATAAVPQPVATCLYRIAQEGLSNVAKHAGATGFEVELRQDDHAITLLITDDGAGFDPAERKTDRGTLGLVSMKERAHLVRGGLEVESQPGRGTRVCARIPLTETES
ncbi:MAG TPA: sensor histidine kinase [Nitrospiraceae bacterium]|nr:sensor histidine kinase [Nitrospiraceae bacterium]